MHDIVEQKLPKALAWGQSVDFDVGQLPKGDSVMVLLRYLPNIKKDSKNRITNLREALDTSVIKSGDIATFSDSRIDLSELPKKPTKHYPKGTYALEYEIRVGIKAYVGYRLYRDLE